METNGIYNCGRCGSKSGFTTEKETDGSITITCALCSEQRNYVNTSTKNYRDSDLFKNTNKRIQTQYRESRGKEISRQHNTIRKAMRRLGKIEGGLKKCRIHPTEDQILGEMCGLCIRQEMKERKSRRKGK